MRDSKHIRGELTTLLSEQMDVLERETFGGVTDEELCEYDEELCEYEERRDRICELYAELIDREAAA
jgi:hypothetical protein